MVFSSHPYIFDKEKMVETEDDDGEDSSHHPYFFVEEKMVEMYDDDREVHNEMDNDDGEQLKG